MVFQSIDSDFDDSESICDPDPNGVGRVDAPYICTAPIKVGVVIGSPVY